jgi:hypothetical protein
MEQTVTFAASRLADPADAVWRQRAAVAARLDRLRTLRGAVDSGHDLTPLQWGQLFALALDYAPDLILELGRGRGNSTCLFTEAVQGTGARVVSLCLSDDWRTIVRPRLEPVVGAAWFAPLEAREGNLLQEDFDALLATAKRVLVFWDAHGFIVAQHVLAHLLPRLASREHVVAMHDLSDARGNSDEQAYYGDRPLWCGNDWSGPRLRLGHIDTAVEQAIAAVDFTSRNRLALRSADERLRARFADDAAAAAEMHDRLGEFFSLQAHWFYFTLNERQGVFTFPAPVPKAEAR